MLITIDMVTYMTMDMIIDMIIFITWCDGLCVIVEQ